MRTAPRNVVLLDAIRKKLPNPCNGCTDRKVGCHSGCEREAKYKADFEAEYQRAIECYLVERRLNISETMSRSRLKGNKGKYEYWSAYRKRG